MSRRVEFKANRPSDVLSTLVSIYDSNDLFVKELQVLLAQRLLAIDDGDSRRVNHEVRCDTSLSSALSTYADIHRQPLQRKNIEILKIRFGEAALQVCEVMLRDMSDSKRTDTHVQSQLAVSVIFSLFLSTFEVD